MISRGKPSARRWRSRLAAQVAQHQLIAGGNLAPSGEVLAHILLQASQAQEFGSVQARQSL
jgi:hypothetical protein